MPNFYWPLLALPLLISLLMMFLFNNYIIFGAYFVLLLIYVIYLNNRLQKFQKKRKEYLSLLDFFNAYILSLSVKNSLNEALDDTLLISKGAIKDELIVIDASNPLDAFHYLANSFPYPLLDVFIDLLTIYEEQGTDIIHASFPFLQQVEQEKKHIIKEEYLAKRALIHFITLWLFTLIITATFKIALKDLFMAMSGNIFFVASFHIVNVLLIIAAELIFYFYTGRKESKHEKAA